MDYIVTEMTMSRFRRYYEEMRPSGHMHYYNANDRLRSGFPGNRLKYANIPRLEVSFDVDYIAFSFNPNRIVLGNSAGRITFNRVEKILMYSGQFCGDAAYIFCKDSDTVYCVQFDKYRANGKGGEQSPPLCLHMCQNRLDHGLHAIPSEGFQSTLPVGGATAKVHNYFRAPLAKK